MSRCGALTPNMVSPGLKSRWTFSSAVQKANPGIRTMGDYVRMANRRARLTSLGQIAMRGMKIGAVMWFMSGVALVGALVWRARDARGRLMGTGTRVTEKVWLR